MEKAIYMKIIYSILKHVYMLKNRFNSFPLYNYRIHNKSTTNSNLIQINMLKEF